MPQLMKGGKWVYGWCIVGQNNEIQIPPVAFTEYSFQAGQSLFITRGSRRSGGFGIGKQERVANSPIKLHIIGQTTINTDGLVRLPPEITIPLGKQLLAVRGSGLALGFIQFGPIYEEALKHPEIETFHDT